MQKYTDTLGMNVWLGRLLSPLLKLVDLYLRTPPFYGFVDGNTAKKDAFQFPFDTYLKVRTVQNFWFQYEEPDGTIWQVTHYPLVEIRWIEILPET